MGRPGPQSHATKYEAGTSSSTQKPLLQRLDEIDKELSLTVHGRGLAVPRWILRGLEYSGDGLLSIPLTAALWIAPILMDKPDVRSFLFNIFVAFIFDLVFIGLVKSFFRRPRPVYNKGMYLVLAVDHYSFPSGHSSRALMIAAFFTLYMSMWKDFVAGTLHQPQGIEGRGQLRQPQDIEGRGYLPGGELCAIGGLWLWALSTASSRVLLGRHYVFDVVVGSLLGVLEALFAHVVLFVPRHVSQSIHGLLLRIFRQT